jgi:hypothetical protein
MEFDSDRKGTSGNEGSGPPRGSMIGVGIAIGAAIGGGSEHRRMGGEVGRGGAQGGRSVLALGVGLAVLLAGVATLVLIILC